MFGFSTYFSVTHRSRAHCPLYGISHLRSHSVRGGPVTDVQTLGTGEGDKSLPAFFSNKTLFPFPSYFEEVAGFEQIKYWWVVKAGLDGIRPPPASLSLLSQHRGTQVGQLNRCGTYTGPNTGCCRENCLLMPQLGSDWLGGGWRWVVFCRTAWLWQRRGYGRWRAGRDGGRLSWEAAWAHGLTVTHGPEAVPTVHSGLHQNTALPHCTIMLQCA